MALIVKGMNVISAAMSTFGVSPKPNQTTSGGARAMIGVTCTIVITGSSLGGHEDEAVKHDYHLLIKPVLPNKLRAMIAFKLNVKAAG